MIHYECYTHTPQVWQSVFFRRSRAFDQFIKLYLSGAKPATSISSSSCHLMTWKRLWFSNIFHYSMRIVNDSKGRFFRVSITSIISIASISFLTISMSTIKGGTFGRGWIPMTSLWGKVREGNDGNVIALQRACSSLQLYKLWEILNSSQRQICACKLTWIVQVYIYNIISDVKIL